MDRGRWQQVKQIFQKAVERPAAERIPFVERRCGDDAELLAEVMSLLASDLDETEFLEVPQEPAAGPATGPARQPSFDSDRYRVLQKIGEGGMGEVYEAEQREPVVRRVALKVIKRGMDTREVIARFESERQALALMSHRSIARVFDAGSTAQGRPYFAMEFVEGIPITDYCDRHRLAPRERIRLFREVCSAVQHAHQKGVIHRDLKPSNILVKVEGGDPVPKVIDFGVSKATAQRLTERTLFTQLGHWVGTPEYMSPEQADLSSLDVDTRTDVYALGVVLYELLVGARPFDPETLRKAGFDEIRRVIREEEPPRPSTRVSTLGEASETAARNRGVDPTVLRRSLRGDLDAIAMKALEKDRTRRYGSPTELADDLSRYLNDQPVRATAPGAVYRARKFVRRHRLAVAAAGVALAALFIGGGVALWQARIAIEERDRAERRFDDVRKLAGTLIFDVYDAIDQLAGSTPARELVVREALAYLDALATEADGDPDLQHELAEGYTRIGNVQGYPYHSNLGDLAGAGRSYDRALELLEPLAAERPADPDRLSSLGQLHLKRGVLESELSDVDAAVAEYRRALALGRRLASDYPGEAGGERLVVVANEALGIAHEELAEFEQALERYRSNLEVEARVLAREPGSAQARNDVVGSRIRIGQTLQSLHRWDEAAGEFRAAIDILDALVREDPDNAVDRRTRAVVERELARCYGHLGQFAAARELFEEAWSALRPLSELDPDDVLLVGDLGVVAAQRARALHLEGRSEASLAWFRTALAQGRALPKAYRDSYDVVIYLIRIHLHHAEALLERGRRDEALEQLRLADGLGEALEREHPRRALAWPDLASVRLRLAETLLEREAAAETCAVARRAFERGFEGYEYLQARRVPLGWPGPDELAALDASMASCG